MSRNCSKMIASSPGKRSCRLQICSMWVEQTADRFGLSAEHLWYHPSMVRARERAVMLRRTAAETEEHLATDLLALTALLDLFLEDLLHVFKVASKDDHIAF